MQFIKDPGFHFIRGLVGKGYGQNMPVNLRVGNDEADKIAGEGIGFPGPSRSSIYGET